MNPLHLSPRRPFFARRLAVLAGALGIVLAATASAAAFTFNDAAPAANSGSAMRFNDPADRTKSRMSGDNATDRSTLQGGNTTLQFGGRETFNERNSGDRYFAPNNLMGR